MTTGKAVEILENGEFWGEFVFPCDNRAVNEFHAALDVVISAVQAVREPAVRTRWKGCRCCTAGDGEHRVPLKKWGREDYCPHCGRPLTEEAWAELERNLEGV